MSHRFIECLSVIWSESIEYSGMETCLIPDIHRIIDDDDREYETYCEFIAPGTIDESHRCRKCYDKCRMCRWHTTTSEHPSKGESSLQCMNESLYHYRYQEWYYWYNNDMIYQKCMKCEHRLCNFENRIICFSRRCDYSNTVTCIFSDEWTTDWRFITDFPVEDTRFLWTNDRIRNRFLFLSFF